MAHGKSQFCGWYCEETGALHSVSAYPKNRNDEIIKEKKMYSKGAKKHTMHKRKDLKKSS